MDRLALALLILCNFIWALNPWMGKVLLDDFHGVQIAWFRYTSAFLAYFFYAAIRVAFFGNRWSEYFFVPRHLRTGVELAVLGIGPFVFSPILQFKGLETAQAMDNSILVATEPLILVVLARIILGERMHREHQISMALAVLGLLLFSGVVPSGLSGFSIGMLFLLLAQFGEGAYSVLSKKLVLTREPKAVLGSALLIGSILLTIFVLGFDRIPSLAKLSFTGIAAVFWLGPIGSTVTYLIWTIISKNVQVPSMAITLFIQPMVGSLVGYLMLGERLMLGQVFGAVLILTAIAFLVGCELRRFTLRSN